MIMVSLEKAQEQLPELIEKLASGEEVTIIRDDEPVARLVQPGPNASVPVFGRCAGKLTILVEDDEHLKDFEEYMP